MTGSRLLLVAHFVLAPYLMLFWAGASHAYSVYYNENLINIGELDVFIDSAKLSKKGLNAEKEWVESILKSKVEFTQKYEFESEEDVPWIQVSQGAPSRIYAFHLEDEPEYFLIKTGNNRNENSGQNLTHFLFRNNEGFDWAVIDLADFGEGYTIKEIGKLSHLVGYDDIVSAPEPSALLLLGSGLIGLSFVARVRRRC